MFLLALALQLLLCMFCGAILMWVWNGIIVAMLGIGAVITFWPMVVLVFVVSWVFRLLR